VTRRSLGKLMMSMVSLGVWYWGQREGGVGDHDGGVVELPEAPVVGVGDAFHPRGHSGAFGGDLGVVAESGDGFADEVEIFGTRDEGEEVALVGEAIGDEGGVVLAAFFVGEVADGIEGEHGGDVFILGFELLCVVVAAHGGGGEVGRFFVDEEDEFDGAREGRGVFEGAGEFEECGDGGGVVVGAGALAGGVVVCADDD
jgi:hypothetical protein